jgi:hypothetical protein
VIGLTLVSCSGHTVASVKPTLVVETGVVTSATKSADPTTNSVTPASCFALQHRRAQIKLAKG